MAIDEDRIGRALLRAIDALEEVRTQLLTAEATGMAHDVVRAIGIVDELHSWTVANPGWTAEDYEELA